MPSKVRAYLGFGKYRNIEVEDDVTAYFEYENGATAVFVTTTGETPGTNRFEITGDNGKLVLENGKLTFWRNRQPMNQFLRESEMSFATPECWEIPFSGFRPDDGHAGILRNFVAAIQNGTPLLSPGVEGIRGLTLSNAMHLSSWTDSWVDIPMDEELFYTKMQEKIATSRFAKKDTTNAGPAADMANSFKK